MSNKSSSQSGLVKVSVVFVPDGCRVMSGTYVRGPGFGGQYKFISHPPPIWSAPGSSSFVPHQRLVAMSAIPSDKSRQQAACVVPTPFAKESLVKGLLGDLFQSRFGPRSRPGIPPPPTCTPPEVTVRLGEQLDKRVLALQASGGLSSRMQVTGEVRPQDQRGSWQVDAMLTQYQATVQNQTKEFKFLSYGGPDGSRVGTKKLHLSVAAVAGGLAWHNPPQAFLVWCQPRAFQGEKAEPYRLPDNFQVWCYLHFLGVFRFGG